MSKKAQKLLSELGIQSRTPKMFEVAEQIEEYRKNPGRALILGDSGTGKRTVSSFLTSVFPDDCQGIGGKANFRDPEAFLKMYHSDEFGVRCFPSLEGALPVQSDEFVGSKVFIQGFDVLNPVNQFILANCFEQDHGPSKKMKVVATANQKFYKKFLAGDLYPSLFLEFETRIFMPKLIHRFDDLELLVPSCYKSISENNSKQPRELRPDCIEAFRFYDWPGNLNEFRNVLWDLMYKETKFQIDYREVKDHLEKRKQEGLGDWYARLNNVNVSPED